MGVALPRPIGCSAMLDKISEISLDLTFQKGKISQLHWVIGSHTSKAGSRTFYSFISGVCHDFWVGVQAGREFCKRSEVARSAAEHGASDAA